MTDEERKNRNPAVEYDTFREEDHPEVHADNLGSGHVYILQGPKHAASLNYMGLKVTRVGSSNIEAHVFYGPRVNVTITLRQRPDGALEDGDGNKITIREYRGPDA